MRSLLTALLLCSCSLLTQAQVNTEKLRPGDPEALTMSLDGSFALRAGNTSYWDVGAGLRVDYPWRQHLTFVIGDVQYGERRGAAFKNRAFIHLRYIYRQSDWLRPEGFTQLEEDGFTLLQLRFLLGGGLRTRLADTQPLKLYLGTALMYETENLDQAKVSRHPAQTEALRWSNYLALTLRFGEQVTLVNTVYFQPWLADFKDYRILNEAALGISVSERLAFTTTFSLRHDAVPPDDLQETDIRLRHGLRITW